MTATYLLRSITDAVEIGTGLPFNWFRGHARMIGRLTPRSHRRSELMEALVPDAEMKLIEAFKRDAPAIATVRLPADDDTLGWLYVMQHHLTPTRLLDWTESALAALFFAVGRRNDFAFDGELWAMLPWALNKEAGVGWAIPLNNRNPVLDFLVKEPYHNNRTKLAREIADKYRGRVSGEWMKDPKPFDRPIAFEPRRDFARMLVQSSVFTIHPKPSKGNTIPEVLTDERYLVRYIVPRGQKEKLWDHLRALGITDGALFPDFEGLSRTIAPEREPVAYGPPAPPKCGGPYEVEVPDTEEGNTQD